MTAHFWHDDCYIKSKSGAKPQTKANRAYRNSPAFYQAGKRPADIWAEHIAKSLTFVSNYPLWRLEIYKLASEAPNEVIRRIIPSPHQDYAISLPKPSSFDEQNPKTIGTSSLFTATGSPPVAVSLLNRKTVPIWLCKYMKNGLCNICWRDGILGNLLHNVLKSLESLGKGLVCARPDLAQKLHAGQIQANECFRPMLRLVYGLIFLLATGEPVPCDVKDNAPGNAFCAAWLAKARKVLATFEAASDANPECPEIEDMGEAALAAAIRHLVHDENGQAVDWKNIDARTLGAIHEAILALQPVFSQNDFALQNIRAGQRKLSGSYYTPAPLIELLLDSALEPAIERALQAKNPEAALLKLKICDPACGSGHFLLAAAKRLARRLASLRPPSANAMRAALRDALANCVYGVDINPESVLICKMCFQLENHALAGPDYHLACGNFLLGASSAQILSSLSDGKGARHIFKNPDLVARFRNRARQIVNAACPPQKRGASEKRDLKNLLDLWTALQAGEPLARHLATWIETGRLETEIAAHVEARAKEFHFFHLEIMFPEAAEGFDVVLSNPPWEHNEIREKEWFCANGRQDIGNLAGSERKKAIAGERDTTMHSNYLAAQRAYGATRLFYTKSGKYPLCGRGRINLYAIFAEAMLASLNKQGRLGCILPSGIATDNTTRHFFSALVESGRLLSLHDFENRERIFPDIDSRIKFCLLTAAAENPGADAQYAFFLHSPKDLAETGRCFSLSAAEIALVNPNTRTCPVFTNEKDAILAKAVYRRQPILVKTRGRAIENPWKISFSQGMFNMTADSRLFRSEQDLVRAGFRLCGNVFAANGEKFLPLYEAKMLHHFNHRWAGWANDGKNRARAREVMREDLENPDFVVRPRYWVAEDEVVKRFGRKPWMLGLRNVCRATDERTLVGGVFPWSAVGNSLPIWWCEAGEAPYLASMLSSFACDFFARFKVGGTNFNFYLARQIAVLPPEIFRQPFPRDASQSLAGWLRPRILELAYTANDMRPYAESLGYAGEPFAWNEERRFLLRAELDAAFFHLYLPAAKDGTWQECQKENAAQYRELKGLFPSPRHAVCYIMDSFPIRRKKDLQKYGFYRTKEQILKNYDRMGF